MYSLNWTYPGYFDDETNEVALHHAIARYHTSVASAYLSFKIGKIFKHSHYRFLDLMASSPGTLLVPTLDIDLIWHTHQLRSEDYQADTEQYVGRFINQYNSMLLQAHQ
jgi:hypothetical protein